MAQCDQLAQQHYNQHVQLTSQANAAYNGTYSQNQSQTLQGAQWTYANTDSGPLLNEPNPVDGRPYNQRGGLRPPLLQHQTDLVQRMPRNPDGTFVVNPDPRVGDWLSVANDGGPSFDPARGINCLDCMVSFWESWRGTPRVSAPRTYDSYQGTNPLAINRGEEHGMDRAAALTGGQWQSFMPSMSPPQQRPNLPAAQTQQFVDWGYQGIDAQLRNMGPGSAMFIITEWEGGSSHAWLAINQGGEIVYVDSQSGQTSTDSPLYAHTGNPGAGNVSAIHGIPLDSNGNAQTVQNLGNHVAQMEQFLVNQVQQQAQPQTAQQPQQTQVQQTQQNQNQQTQAQQNQNQAQQTQQSAQQQTNTQQAQTPPSPQQNQTQAQYAQTQQQTSPEVTQQIPVQQQTNADVTQQVSVQQQSNPDVTQQIPVQQQGDPDVTQTVSPDLTQAKVSLEKASVTPDADQTQQIQVPQQQSTPDPRVAFQQGTPPPQQPPSAPPRPHRPPDPAGLAPGSVPFGYEEFFNDPRWADQALAFEQALGAHLFNSPAVLQTARESVTHLRDAMTALAAIDPSITPADIERAFCPDITDFDEPEHLTASAGQAGPEASLDDLLERGNVRELMTAFFNAAYNFRQGSTLGNLVQQAIESGNYDAAIAAGLDVDLLRRIKAELDVSEDYRDREEFKHRSIFTVGTVNLLSDHAMWDFYETVRSHDGRDPRSLDEQRELSNTPQHYADLGTPLGEFERAFLERVMGAQLEPDTRLPWREGHTLFNTQSEWVHIMEARGFPTAAGISMTTTRMLTVARMLDMDPAQQQAFMDALMAWMLPCRDHSLAEIYRAAMISGLDRVSRDGFNDDLSVVELYREMTGLDLAELRDEIGIRLEPTDPPLLPHEAAYLQQVREGRFTDVTPAMMQTAQMNWDQLRSGVLLTDEQWREATGRKKGENPLRAWLERAGIDPADTEAVQAVTERLSLSHIISFTVYTGYGYGLINAAITGRMDSEDQPCARRIAEAIPDADLTVDDTAVREEVRAKAESLIDKYIDKYLERMSEPRQTPPSIAQVMQSDAGRRWVDAAHRRDEAERDRDRLLVEGQHDEAHAAARRVYLANADMQAARLGILQDLDVALDGIVAEMKWHADMIVDGMSQLPPLGTPDTPVLVYRGDGMGETDSALYGSTEDDPGPMPKLVSTTAERQPAYIFMGNDPSITDENRVFVVYELTGQYAADISPFSVFPTQAEVLLPPGARVHRVADPELAERLRQEILADPKLPNRVRQFKVVIMREGEAAGEGDGDA